MNGDERRCSEQGQLLRRLRITTPERVAGLDKPVEPERSLRPIDKQFAANPTGRPAIELTSAASRCSIGMSAPVLASGSIVLVGATTTNGTRWWWARTARA